MEVINFIRDLNFLQLIIIYWVITEIIEVYFKNKNRCRCKCKCNSKEFNKCKNKDYE